jgi:predicted phosphodiesterase
MVPFSRALPSGILLFFREIQVPLHQERLTSVAALYDIHGNLPALEAALDDVRRFDVEAIVIGGDVLPGPMPKECLDMLYASGIRTVFIHGNGESAALECRRGRTLENVPAPFRPAVEWSARQIPGDYLRAIGAWPMTLRLTIDGIGSTLFVHATARNDTELLTRLSPDDRVRAVFPGVHDDLVVCGHTHMQFDRTVDRLRVVNAGSVGMPFGEPGAHWLLLGGQVQLRRTPYDPETAAARLRRSAFPGVEQFVERQVLHPPSEEQMLAAYAKADGRE